MDSTMDIFNPPARSRPKRATSSTRSFRSTSSKRSDSKPPQKPIYSDLIGMKATNVPELTHQESPTLKFPSSISVTSHSSSESSRSTGTVASTSTKASSVAEIIPIRKTSASQSSSMTGLSHHDLFGTKIPPTEAELAPSAPDAVQLTSGPYKVPEPIDKQFYRDLTFLEDEELIRKYGLIKVQEQEKPEPAPEETTSKKLKKKAQRDTVMSTSYDIVKFV